MAAFMTFDVTPDDGKPYRVDAMSRDVLKLEKSTKGVTMSGFRDNLLMAHIYKLAWIAATRVGKTTADLATFEATTDVDIADEEEEEEGATDPTRTGLGIGSASP